MKKIIYTIVILSMLTSAATAQEMSIGFSAGAAYYNGELNPRNVFYMPTASFGLLYRHNFNERITLRISGSYEKLRGDDSKSNNPYQKARNWKFESSTWDIGPQIEINFKNFNTSDLLNDYFAPYLTTGVLLTIVPDSKKPLEVAIPIGLGFKYALTKKITAGLEWTYRWTNSDEIDNLHEDNFSLAEQQRSHNPDNDWYASLGFVITFKIFEEKMTCPAFYY